LDCFDINYLLKRWEIPRGWCQSYSCTNSRCSCILSSSGSCSPWSKTRGMALWCL